MQISIPGLVHKVKNEKTWVLFYSDPRSVTFSFTQDCFSSMANISGGKHQQHKQDWKETCREKEKILDNKLWENKVHIQKNITVQQHIVNLINKKKKTLKFKNSYCIAFFL